MGENIEKSEVKLTVGQRFLRLLLTLRRALIPIFVYLLWGMLFELLWALLLAVFASAFPETAFLRFLQENEGLFLMLAISLPSFFVLYRMYRRDCFWFQADTGERKPVPCPGCLLLTALGAASGFNILLQLSPLIRMFPSIVEVNAELAGSSLLLSLCYTVLAAPVVEELLFRGLLYRRLREGLPFLPAAVVSALLFGAMHANMVQFIYASVVGLLLAWIYERYGNLKAAVLFHAIGNLTGNLSGLFTSRELLAVFPAAGWIGAAGFLLLMAWGISGICRKVALPVYRWRSLPEE